MRKGWYKKARLKWYHQRLDNWAVFIKPEDRLIVLAGWLRDDYGAFLAYRKICLKYPQRLEMCYKKKE